jgi:SAM-dependent methyltransferase
MRNKIQCNGWLHRRFGVSRTECHTRTMASELPSRGRGYGKIESEKDAHTRRASFDSIARLYDQARPGYPDALFSDLCQITDVGTQSRLLEIGCGTGHATLPLAARGLHIDCVELGEQMAAVAREKLVSHPCVQVTVADFDTWETNARYRLVYAASAYHWLNPETRVERIARLLEPRGWLAAWRSHHVRGSGASAEFFLAAQSVYARQAPALAAKFTGLDEAAAIRPEEVEEWQASGRFEEVQTRAYAWTMDYTAGAYVGMLDTHSDHRTLPAGHRARLYDGIARLVDAFGGKVTREQATILCMARKKN